MSKRRLQMGKSPMNVVVPLGVGEGQATGHLSCAARQALRYRR
jgi:hypothetical protein